MVCNKCRKQFKPAESSLVLTDYSASIICPYCSNHIEENEVKGKTARKLYWGRKD